MSLTWVAIVIVVLLAAGAVAIPWLMIREEEKQDGSDD